MNSIRIANQIFYCTAFFILIANFSAMSQEKDTTQKSKPTYIMLNEFEEQVIVFKGTERAYTGEFWNHFDNGTYICRQCNAPLYRSNTKFESHCGWPSFDDAIEGTVIKKLDKSLGMIRTEIICAGCDGHLGHVFNDGPKQTTGLRYCINTSSLKFVKGTD